jgi:hypothetical protein
MGYLFLVIMVLSIYGFQVRNGEEKSGPETQCQTLSFSDEDLKSSKHCFRHQISIESYPWELGDCLNFEEVFKNHQYFETHTVSQKSRLLIKKYVVGKSESVSQYAINADNRLIGPCQNSEK